MAKVLFISNVFENLGIEYLSAALKKSGHRTSLLIDPCLFNDCYNKNYMLGRWFNMQRYIVDEIREIKPDIICFSVLTDTYQWASSLAKAIKCNYSAVIFFGGIHVTLLPEDVINNEYVDMICIGEGERVIVEVADCIDALKDFNGIKSVWFKSKKGLIKNEIRTLERNLDVLAFPDKELYYNYASFYKNEYLIMTSRGCDYACSFCCNHILRKMYPDHYVRRRSVDNVIEELLIAKKNYDPKFIWFMDDLFACDIDWLEQFSSRYKKEIGLPFFAYVHPNSVTSKTIVLLEKMGCQEIGLGVQTIKQVTRRNIKRFESIDKIIKAIHLIKRSKIVCCAENIIGLPQEDEEDIQMLAEFYNQNRPDIIVYSALKVFPKAEIECLLRKDALVNNSNYWKGNSLAMGGNVKISKSIKKIAAFLPLINFMPKNLVALILKIRLYRIIPSFLFLIIPKMVRAIHSCVFFKSFFKITHDAGAKVYINAYVHFFKYKLRFYK